MRYTKNDIKNIPLTEFMAALGEKPVKAFGDMKLYYAPQRDDPEPMLVVDTKQTDGMTMPLTRAATSSTSQT